MNELKTEDICSRENKLQANGDSCHGTDKPLDNAKEAVTISTTKAMGGTSKITLARDVKEMQPMNFFPVWTFLSTCRLTFLLPHFC